MNILFLGDVTARSGRDAVMRRLPKLKQETSADFTIVNDGSLQELEARVEAVARELFRIRSERYGEREAGE